MLSPASAISPIFSRKGGLTAYLLAAETNISKPVTRATAKADQVQGRISEATSSTGRRFQERPSRRRSRMAIEPTTSAMAITWMVSKVGNIQGDWLIATPSGVLSICLARVLIHNMSVPSGFGRHIGDQAAAHGNSAPQRQGQDGDQARLDGMGGAIPVRGIGPYRALEQHGVKQCADQQDHLDLEGGVSQ